MFIDGIGISRYRSFGTDLQRIGPFAKFNLFIGQNNSGKSNILRFISSQYRVLVESIRDTRNVVEISGLDSHLGANDGNLNFEIALDTNGEYYSHILTNKLKNDPTSKKILDRILTSKFLSPRDGLAWFPYGGANHQPMKLLDSVSEAMRNEHIASETEWYKIWVDLTSQGQGHILQHWIPETLRKISPAGREIPKIAFIPAIRQISESRNGGDLDFSGTGIVDKLARFQNPSHDQQNHKRQFGKIIDFLQDVTENSSATLEIPYERNEILVHMDGKTLPLSSLGTGIHEVVILAAAATVLNQQIICIEEPEIHLHPHLQKKLVRYLVDNT